MKTRIDVDTRTFVRFWLVPLLIFVAAWLIYNARTAVIILATALFLALALSPLVGRLTKLLPSKSRVLSTLTAYLAVVIVIGGFVVLVVPPIVRQTAKLVEAVPGLVNKAIAQYHGFGQFITQYHLQPQVDTFLESLKHSASGAVGVVGSNIVGSIGSVAGVVAATILVLALTFFMLVEGPTWVARLWHLYTDKNKMRHHQQIMGKMYSAVTSYVSGQLFVSALDGLCAGLAVFVLGLIFHLPLDFSIPAAAIMFVFSLIPMFGALLGALMVALIIAFNSWIAALIYLAYVVLYQQLEGNVISPRVQSRRVDLTPLAVLASVTIGVYLFGIAGAIVSIPVAGIVKILIDEYIEHVKQRDAEPAHKVEVD